MERSKVEGKEVKKGKVFTRVKKTLPRIKEVYKGLRDELKKLNEFTFHYADSAVCVALSILKWWKRRIERRISFI